MRTRLPFLTRATLLAACLALHGFAPALAAVFNVNSTIDEPDANLSDVLCAGASGFCTLRAAIQEANDSPGHDIISVPQGIYTLTVPGSGEDAAATGDLDVTDEVDIEGESLTNLTVVDGGGLDRVFDLRGAGGLIRIAAMTIRNGSANEGGAIQALAPLIDLDALQIESNVASTGPAGRGGGLYVAAGSDVRVRYSAIVDNATCVGGFFCAGGGVYSDGTLQILDSTIHDNASDSGGAMFVGDGTVRLGNATIAGNAASFGGGVWVGAATVEMANTIIADNTAATGPDCTGTLDSDGYNLVESIAGCTVAGDATGVQTGVDPAFEPYALTEFGTGALRLTLGSPAIDAGNPAALSQLYPACRHEDQRFHSRTSPCDVGAHERGICPTFKVSGGCKQANTGKSSLLIKVREDPSKSQLKWKWAGDATSDAELGDGSTDYALCGYAEVASLPGVGVQWLYGNAPGGGTCGTKPCWKDSTTGLSYKDKEAPPDGLTAISLKSGIAGKAKLAVQGKGSLTSGLGSPPYGPLGITMQLRKPDDTCWEATFTTPKKDVAGTYQAKND